MTPMHHNVQKCSFACINESDSCLGPPSYCLCTAFPPPIPLFAFYALPSHPRNAPSHCFCLILTLLHCSTKAARSPTVKSGFSARICVSASDAHALAPPPPNDTAAYVVIHAIHDSRLPRYLASEEAASCASSAVSFLQLPKKDSLSREHNVGCITHRYFLPILFSHSPAICPFASCHPTHLNVNHAPVACACRPSLDRERHAAHPITPMQQIRRRYIKHKKTRTEKMPLHVRPMYSSAWQGRGA